MTALNGSLPGTNPTARSVRDDGKSFSGVTLPTGSLPSAYGAAIAATAGLTASEIARARNAVPGMTHIPREPLRQGTGWAIFVFPASIQVYVMRDDGTHLSYGAPQPLFTSAQAIATLSALPGLTAGELARIATIA